MKKNNLGKSYRFWDQSSRKAGAYRMKFPSGVIRVVDVFQDINGVFCVSGAHTHGEVSEFSQCLFFGPLR